MCLQFESNLSLGISKSRGPSNLTVTFFFLACHFTRFFLCLLNTAPTLLRGFGLLITSSKSKDCRDLFWRCNPCKFTPFRLKFGFYHGEWICTILMCTQNSNLCTILHVFFFSNIQMSSNVPGLTSWASSRQLTNCRPCSGCHFEVKLDQHLII